MGRKARIKGKAPTAPATATRAEGLDTGPVAADRILELDLPSAIEEFTTTYAPVKEACQLLETDHKGASRRIGQVSRHLRNVSWPLGLSKAQGQVLISVWEKALPVVQTILLLVAALDLGTCLEKATAAAYHAACMLALEIAATYFALVGTLRAPAVLFVEEVESAAIKCLRQCMRQLVLPLLSPVDQERQRRASAAGGTEAAKTAAVLFGPQDNADACAAAALVLQELHEFLCRHRLPDEQLHQLVHMTAAVFFCPDPNFKLRAAAEELLVTLFARKEALRTSILQEVFAGAPRLASGKRARKFQLPVADDNSDYGLSTYTHLLLRLAQSTCLPLQETIGAEVEFAQVLSQRTAAQSILVQLTSGLFQRLLFARVRDEEARAVLDELLDEMLLVAFRPPWPAALALVRTATQQLIGVVQPERKKEGADTSIREFALKLLSKVVICLWGHHVETSQSVTALPAWDLPPEKVPKDERLLQHIALRSSLSDARDLPWTAVARAVEAWDGELFLGERGSEKTGLRHFTDDVVFMYLTMAHLEDERAMPARLAQSGAGASPALNAVVFSAGHSVHARSFLAADWAEAVARQKKEAGDSKVPDEAPGSKTAKRTRQKTALELLMATLWTSSAPFDGEGSVWRCSTGRRVLLPFTVYKVYRQLRVMELEGLRRAALDCVVMQANAPQASLRKTAVRTLCDLVGVDAKVLELEAVEATVDMRLRDESSLVRQVSLDLLGRVLEESVVPGKVREVEGEEDAPEADDSEPIRLDPSGQAGASASAMLLRFHQTVRGRINDTSPLVRRQASKILSAFVLSHPDHPDVVDVALDLVRRSSDSEQLRNLVYGTFELLWFMDDEPTPRAAQQFARVVDDSTSRGCSENMLEELLRRFRKTISSRKHSRGFEFAVRRWTTLLLNEFVQVSAAAEAEAERPPEQAGGKSVAPRRQLKRTDTGGSEVEPPAGVDSQAPWVRRRALLATLEAFADVQPRDMQAHLRPLAVYLALEESATSEERWVALKVCRILSSVLPYVAERRGLLDHRQVQQDLQALIKNQPSAGVHEAVRCLCLVVKYVTGDLPQLLQHLNTAVPALTQLCSRAEGEGGSLEKIQLMYMSRQVWVLSSVLESLAIDDYVQMVSGEVPPGARRLLPRQALRFEFVGGSVAATVSDLLVRLYTLGEPLLRAVVVTCLGFFLRGQRRYVKDRRMGEIFSTSLSSGDPSLCLKALETLASLLAHFGSEADRETKADGKETSGKDAGVTRTETAEVLGGHASAVETAQPLAAHSETVLGHVALAGSIGPGKDVPADKLLRIRAEALAVIRQLHRQGLVNPMAVLPKVFALSFAGEPLVSEPACLMLKEVLQIRPTLLLNRLDEAFREAFLAVLASGGSWQLGEVLGAGRLAALGEVYGDRFRRQRTAREAFIRKALREVCRRASTRDVPERFALLAEARAAQEQKEADGPKSKRPRKLVLAGSPTESAADPTTDNQAVLSGLPLQQIHQVLYAHFVISALSALPFVYESEPLLLVFECNHHLALRAGTLLSNFEKPKAEGDDRPEESASQQPKEGNVEVTASSQGEPPAMTDPFGEAIAILACVLLKKVIKAEYSLTSEQCAQFNPKEPRQERLRSSISAPMRSTGTAGQPSEDVATGAVRSRIPAGEWLELVSPAIRVSQNTDELTEYLQTLLEGEPLDDDHTRHAETLARVAAGGRGRGRGAGAAKRKAQEEEPEEPEGRQPGRRGRAGRTPRGSPRGRGHGRSRGRGRKRAAATDVEEDDSAIEGSDWEHQ